MRPGTGSERFLTPAEVARLFSVNPKTVTRWAKAGKLTSIRTLGGHRRFREAEVRDLLAADTPSPSAHCPDCRHLRTSPGHKLACGIAS